MANGGRQLHVLISGGFTGAYERLLPEFKRSSGIEVATGSGASQGSGPQTIAAQLARGMAADVVILSREGLTELITADRIATGSDVDLACVGLGVAVRSGTPKPDVSTVEAFKQTALRSKSIAVPASTSGIWLTKELFPRLGIAGKISVKTMTRGSDATRAIAVGEADLGILPVSEIMTATGVDFAGSLAPEIQFMQTFSAAAVVGSAMLADAKRLIEHLSSASAREAISASGMDPVTAAK